jgi:hypothetical protein
MIRPGSSDGGRPIVPGPPIITPPPMPLATAAVSASSECVIRSRNRCARSMIPPISPPPPPPPPPPGPRPWRFAGRPRAIVAAPAPALLENEI